MKLRFLIVFLSMLCNIALAATPVKWVDRVIMIINDDVITERDLNDMMFSIKKQLPKGSKLSPEDLKAAATQRLLEEKLLVQFSKEHGITVSDAQIDEQLQTIASARKISVAKLYELINKEGVDKKSLRNTIANNIIVDNILNDSLPANLEVTTGEINDFLTKNHLPITPENQEQAAVFIKKQKFQQTYNSIIEQLRSAAYIKVNDKPY